MILLAFLFPSGVLREEYGLGSFLSKKNEESHGAQTPAWSQAQLSSSKIKQNSSWTQANPKIHGQERNARYFKTLNFRMIYYIPLLQKKNDEYTTQLIFPFNNYLLGY